MTRAALVVAAVLVTRDARADGEYGRFNGDLLLAAEAGAAGSSRGAALGVRLTASYLMMAGMYVEYDDGLGRRQPLARRIAGGIDLRPVFLARFVNDLERGSPAFDLWLDSLGVSLGAYHAWMTPECEARCREHGAEAMLHMALPLLLRANSPIIALRGGFRFAVPEEAGPPALEPAFFLSIGYQHLVATGLVQWKDPRQ